MTGDGEQRHGLPDPRNIILEDALVTAVWALENAVAEGTTRSVDEEDAILAGLKETLATLGLAHRVRGIPAEAEAEAEGAVS